MRGAETPLRFHARPIYHTSHLQLASQQFNAKLKMQNAKVKKEQCRPVFTFCIFNF
jgi:hypothetical protein